MPRHSRVAPNLQECVHVHEALHNVDGQRGIEHILRRCTCIYFVESEHETLSLHFAPPCLLYQLAATPSWILCIENKEDNIRLVDNFV